MSELENVEEFVARSKHEDIVAEIEKLKREAEECNLLYLKGAMEMDFVQMDLLDMDIVTFNNAIDKAMEDNVTYQDIVRGINKVRGVNKINEEKQVETDLKEGN